MYFQLSFQEISFPLNHAVLEVVKYTYTKSKLQKFLKLLTCSC